MKRKAEQSTAKADRAPTDKPRKSKYALKQRQAVEATHSRHNPPLSFCNLCTG